MRKLSGIYCKILRKNCGTLGKDYAKFNVPWSGFYLPLLGAIFDKLSFGNKATVIWFDYAGLNCIVPSHLYLYGLTESRYKFCCPFRRLWFLGQVLHVCVGDAVDAGVEVPVGALLVVELVDAERPRCEGHSDG